MKVLIVEDDENTRTGLKDILEGEGFTVATASDGNEALEAFEAERPDFLCLDIMMPEVSGYDVCRQIRAVDAAVPIVFISAKSEEIDKVLGLELGADDFIVKPFGVREVVARIRAVARRCLQNNSVPAAETFFQFGDMTVYPLELRAIRDGGDIDLSLREVKILEYMRRRQGRVVARHELFEACWDMEFYAGSRTLDQHISQLRKRIEHNPRQPLLIKTVHGYGYRYDG